MSTSSTELPLIGQRVEKLLRALFSPRSATEYAVYVVFWPYFEPLLDRRPGRQRLFQQPAAFRELRRDGVLRSSLA
jgi:hypothetical protein